MRGGRTMSSAVRRSKMSLRVAGRGGNIAGSGGGSGGGRRIDGAEKKKDWQVQDPEWSEIAESPLASTLRHDSRGWVLIICSTATIESTVILGLTVTGFILIFLLMEG